MTTSPMIVASLVAMLASCGGAGSSGGVDPRWAPSDRVRCQLAEKRCSRCHPFDRVLSVTVSEPVGWKTYVHRMRLVPGSGIAPAEERTIVECLVGRSFGSEGIARLDREGAW